MAEGSDQSSLSSENDLNIDPQGLSDEEKSKLNISEASNSLDSKDLEDDGRQSDYEKIDSNDDSLNIDDSDKSSDSDLNLEDEENKLENSDEISGLVDKDSNQNTSTDELDLDSEKSIDTSSSDINIESDDKLLDKKVEIDIEESKDEYYNNASSFNFKEKKKKEKKKLKLIGKALFQKKMVIMTIFQIKRIRMDKLYQLTEEILGNKLLIMEKFIKSLQIVSMIKRKKKMSLKMKMKKK